MKEKRSLKKVLSSILIFTILLMQGIAFPVIAEEDVQAGPINPNVNITLEAYYDDGNDTPTSGKLNAGDRIRVDVVMEQLNSELVNGFFGIINYNNTILQYDDDWGVETYMRGSGATKWRDQGCSASGNSVNIILTREDTSTIASVGGVVCSIYFDVLQTADVVTITLLDDVNCSYISDNIWCNGYTLNIPPITTPSTYTITYYKNTTDTVTGLPSPGTKTQGTPYTIAAGPTRTGYNFTGWNTAANGTGTPYAAGASYTTDSDLDLYAQWTAQVTTSTVNLVAGTGGTVVGNSSYSGASGTTANITSTATTNTVGYTVHFNGNGGTLVNASDQTKMQGMTFDKWTHSGGGSYNESTKVYTFGNTNGTLTAQYKGDTVTLPAVNRTGYSFNGWFTDENNGVQRTAPYTPTTNETLYAHWTAQSYTITFNADGGSVSPTSASVTYGQTYQTVNSGAGLPTPTKTGFTFAGWFDPNGNQITNSDTVNITENTTLKARWNGATYTVTFNPDGGTVNPTSKQVTNGNTYGNLPTPVKSGYDFAGWFNSNYDQITNTTIVNLTADETLTAQWTGHQYTLTFNPNGGQVNPTSKPITNGQAYGDLPIPTRTGYNFDGWFTDPNNGSQVNASTIANTTINVTIYAHWTAQNYTITFNPGGGSVNPTSKQVTYAQPYGTLPTPTRTGFEFDGWYNGNNKITATDTVNITASTTLVAHWLGAQYTITFDYNGGTGTTTSKQVRNESAYGDLPTPNTRPGYTFDGWFTDANGGNKIESTTIANLTDNQTLFAHWTASTYTITFDPAAGSVNPTSKQVTYGQAYGNMPTPTRDGYNFTGWFDQSGNQVTATDTVNITENTTLTARWEGREFTLTFDPRLGTVSPTSKPITNGQAYGTFPTPTRAGYDFDAWYDANNVKVNETDIVDVTGNITLHAVWLGAEYTVTFDPDGGTVNPTSKTVRNEGYYGELPTPTKLGQKFDGWYNAAGNKIEATTTVNLTADETLTAHWSPGVYTVTFDPGDGTVNTPDKQVTYGEPYGELPTPTKPGYTFTGWKDPSGNPVTKDDIVNLTGDGTLTAGWEGETHTITFTPGDGATVNPGTKEVKNGEPYGSLPTPVKPGYDFDGWVDENGNDITPDTIVDILHDCPVFPKWKGQNLTVTFDPNGGTVNPTSMSVTNGQAYGTLPTPVKPGHDFEGWFDPNGNKVTETDIVNIANNIILTAHWSGKECTITLDPTGGRVNPEDKTVKTGEIYGYLPTPTRKGYTFDGWFTSAVGGTEIEASTIYTLDEDSTIYAHWTANTYTISFNPGDGIAKPADKQVTYDQPYGELPTVSKDKYIFKGWADSSGKIITSTDTVDITKNTTLTAVWEEIGYILTFEPNGGTVTPTEKTVYYLKQYGSMPTPIRDGYVFDGWYTDPVNGNKIETSTIYNIEADSTVYAHWVYDPLYLRSTPYKIGENNINEYQINDKYIEKIEPNTTVAKFKRNCNTNGTIVVINKQGRRLADSELIGTGMTVEDTKGTEKIEIKAIVMGDLDGNGKITVTDLSVLNKRLVGKITLDEMYSKAADLDHNNRISPTDLSMMNQFLIGRITFKYTKP